MIKILSLKKLIYSIGLFFLMFPPHIIIGNFVLKTVYLFIVIPGLFGFLLFLKEKRRALIEKNIIFFMLFAFLYFVFYTAIFLFKDTSVLSQIVMGLIIFYSCFFYVNAYKKIYDKEYLVIIFKHLNIACIINSFFVIATFFSPEFKEFLYSFIGTTKTGHRYLFEDVGVARYQGIVPSGFSFLSTTHSLLLIIGVWGFFMDERKHKTIQIVIFTLCQISIFISILLIGRTGLIIILLFLLALIFYKINLLIVRPVIEKKTLILVSSFVLIIVIGISSINFSKYKRNINFAFELVISLTEKNQLDRSTSGVIKNHFIFPEKTKDILLGTGNFGRSKSLPYIESDVGYVLFITGAGILGMLIGYSFYFAGFLYSFKYRRINPYLSWFISVFFFALLVLNMKDYYFISHIGYSQIFFIMICALGLEVESKRSLVK